MATVKELIEFLETLPEKTEVELYTEYGIKELTIGKHTDCMSFTDYEGNKWIKETDRRYGKTYLTFGE